MRATAHRAVLTPAIDFGLIRVIDRAHGHPRCDRRRRRVLGTRAPASSSAKAGLSRLRRSSRRPIGVGGTWRDEHVSGRGVRRALAPLFVLVRAEPAVVARVRRAGRDPRVPRALRRHVRPAPAPALRPRRDVGARSTSRRRVARAHRSRRRSRARALLLGNGALHMPAAARRARASIASRARRSTPRAGTTTTICAGKRVAVIGTGASAIQFVPQIAPRGRPAPRVPAHAAVDRAEARSRDRRARALGARARPRRALRCGAPRCTG